MKKLLIPLFILLILTQQTIYAQASRSLSQKEIERLKVCKELFNGIDGKTLDESITLLEENTYPKENLILLEAMAKTYAEMVEEQNVVDIKKKEWLYSMVKLNMAYLQLGGYQLKKAHAVPLHQVIQSKLKSYIPVELMENRDLFNPLEF